MKDLTLYRPNVGVVLFNARGQVWYGRRAGAEGPNNWQFPQGGVDKGEDLEAAARRELAEETGVTSVLPLGRTEDWIVYDFPAGYGGSKQARGFAGPETGLVRLSLHRRGGGDRSRSRTARSSSTPGAGATCRKPAT